MISAAEFLKWCYVFDVQFGSNAIPIPVPVADGGTGATTASGARTNLGLAIGTNVEAWNAHLDQLAAITPAQGDILYYNGTAWVALAPGTSGFFLKTLGAGANPLWAVSPGSGTVNSGSINQLAWYAANGTAVSGLTTGNNGVLVTSGGGVPSISSTLPAAVQGNITVLGDQAQALNMGGFQVNNAASPTLSTDLATKGYVDTIATGGAAAVYAASTANLTGYTYLNGTAGVGATLTAGSIGVFTLDGVTPPVGSSILYKDDSDGSGAYNGIYVVTTSSGGSLAVLTRDTDYDTPTDINNTGLIPVTNGSTWANTAWYNTSTVVSVGVTPITFIQFGTISYPISLGHGGTNAALTASNGGIVYSTASQLAILSGTATAGLPLLSGSTAAPTWGAFALSLGGALTTGGAVTFSGAHTFTGTLSANTSVTFPTSGTLATTTGSLSSVTADAGSATVSSGAITISGGSSGLTTSGSGSTINIVGTLSLGSGGTSAALTASNGGIFYSTASAGAILAGTSTANQILMSGASTTPAWSTATYPATITANSILLCGTSDNQITGLGTANSARLGTSSAGVPSMMVANIVTSSSCGNFVGSAGAGPNQVTNLSVTITTTGRPIWISLIPDGTTGSNYFSSASGGTGNLYLFRGVTQLSNLVISVSGVDFGPMSCATVDVPAAGTYTYTCQYSNATNNLYVQNIKLMAMEM